MHDIIYHMNEEYRGELNSYSSWWGNKNADVAGTVL